MPEIETDDPPQTLPLDFFDKQGQQNQQSQQGQQQGGVPTTLPLNFFDQPTTPTPPAGTAPNDSTQPPAESPWFDPGRKEHPWLTAPVDFAQGAVSGAASTLYGINELARKGASYLPGSPDIPNVISKQYTEPPPGVAGQAGHWAEQIGEFFIPASKVGEINKAIELTSKAPMLIKLGAKAAVEAVPAYGITLAQTGGDTTAARNAAIAAGTVTAALPAVGKVLSKYYGATTGVGSVPVARAASQPTPELMAAMRGEITEKEILEATRQAVSNVEQKRSADYIAQLGQIDPRIQVDLRPTRRALNDLANSFRIRRILNPQTQKVELDFSNSHLWSDPAAQQQINSLWDKVMSPMAQDPRSVDALKRGVDAMYRESGQSRAIVEGVRSTLADSLNNTVPGYQNMTREYAETSAFLDDLADLSTKSTNDGTAIRKLAGSLKQNNGFREKLLDELGAYTPRDVKGMIAGSRLATGEPRGIVGALHAAGSLVSPAAFLYMAAHNPALLAGSLINLFGMSPRVVGEVAAKAQAIARVARTSAGAAPRMMRITGQQPDYDANAQQYLPPQKKGGYFELSNGGMIRMDSGGDVDADDDDMPRDTSFSEAMSRANPNPQWLQRANAAINQPFSMPVTGGPPMDPRGVAPRLPESGWDAALMAAGALIPAGVALKNARGAASMLKGAAPEAEALSRGVAQEPPTKMVRLYRGSQSPTRSELPANPPLGEGERGRWFTTDPSATRFYGPHTFSVDVPQAIADAAKEPDTMLGVTGRLLPAEYANQETLYSPPPTGGNQQPVILQDFVAGRGGYANPAHMTVRSMRPVTAEEVQQQFFPDYGPDRLQIQKLRADDFMGAVQRGRQPFRLQFVDKYGRHTSAPEGIEERLGLQSGESYHGPTGHARGGYLKLSNGGMIRMDDGGMMDDPGVFDPNALDAGESNQQILQNVARKRQWLQQHGRLPLSSGQSQMAKGGTIHMDDGGAFGYDPAGLDPNASDQQIIEGIRRKREQLQRQGQIQLGSSPGQFQHPVDPSQIRLGPDAGRLTDPRLANAPPMQVDPDKINLGTPLGATRPGQIKTPLEQPSSRYQTQPDVEVNPPAKPYVEQIPFDWREPDKDLELGARSGFIGLTNMLMKPGESLYGGNVASGVPLSEAVQEQQGPNQEDLAARQYGLAHQGTQFLGSLPPTIAKYALAAASTGLTGLPAAAASGFVADTLAGSGRDSTPEQALTEGAISGATAIMLDVGLSGLGADMTRMGQDVRKAADIARKSYPSMEAFEAAAAKARAQLIQDRAFEPGMTLGSGGGGVGKNLKNVATLMGAHLGVGGYKAAEIATAVGEQVSHLVKQGTLKYAEETPESGAAPEVGGRGAELPPRAETPGVQKRPAGNDAIAQIANDYNAQNGLPAVDHSQYHPLDENFAGRVADAYDALQADNSGDPHVRASYEALVRETKAQYDHLVANGYTLEPWTKEGQPYRNSHEMTADLRDNKHLYFFTGGEAHPFLSAIDPATGLSMNEILRGVHDAYGHAAAGYGFGPRGEEGAHDVHSQMYSPLAQQALTTETRGQNSWVNFGRHNYDDFGNRLDIPPDQRPFARQNVDVFRQPELLQRAGERQPAAATPAAPGQVSVTSNAPPLDLQNSYIPTGIELGSGEHATGLAAYAREIQIKDHLDQDRRANLTPQELDNFEKVKVDNPEIGAVGDYMNSLEVKKALANPQQVEAMTRMLRVLPQAEQMTATMLAGLPKLGWYRGSAQAISDVFGADAPRFAQLLAATSPRISVEGNLMNALNIWKNWDAAGRPEDPQAILEIMAKSVQGKGKESSVMDAWRNNTYAALTSKDPMSLTLSGPKVDSFQHNLRDHVMQVTNDAWMANAYNISQELFGGQGANPAAGNPGMTPEYAAASARLRQAGAAAGMLPSQGQETIWSVAMQLYELARKHKIDPKDVLQKGMLTPQMINATPDFSTIFSRPDIMRILDDIGKGDEVRALKPFAFPGAQHTISDLTLPQQNLLTQTAGTLSDVMGMRGRESASAKFAPGRGWTTEKWPNPNSKSAAQQELHQKLMASLYPKSATGFTNIEEIPGGTTRHLSEIRKLPDTAREHFTGTMYGPKMNAQGQDIIQTAAVGPSSTIPSRNVQGAYINATGQARLKAGLPLRSQDVESNPGRALGYGVNLQWKPAVDVPPSAMPDVGPRPMLNQPAMAGLQTAMPLVGPWRPDIDPQTQADIKGGMAAHAMVGAQEGVGGNVFVPAPPETYSGLAREWPNLNIPLKEEASEFRMRKLAKQYPDYGFASAGPDIHVLGLGGMISEAEAINMLKILKGNRYVPADSIPFYVDFAKEWKNKPGSGQVTTKFFKYADEMSPAAYARLDQDIRQMAGDTQQNYRAYSDRRNTPARGDLMNLLDIVHKGGLAALRTALKNGEFLPGLAVGAVLLPHLLGQRKDSPQQEVSRVQ